MSIAVVTGARDAAIAKVKETIAAGRDLRGFEVDDACRGHIQKNGFGEYLHPSHRALDRPGSSRQWRQYG